MTAGPLAYAFWHWKQAAVSRESYEAAQCGFQAALAAAPPAGFRGGTTVRLRGAPWAAAGEPAYEDWYQVEDMASLERLNEAAVSGTREAPHLAVARLAAGGIAGLYGLYAGQPLPLPAWAGWFAKPAGMSYPELAATMTPLTERARGALWSRRMTLGPTPEFCLQAMAPVELPSRFQVLPLLLEKVWEAPR